MLAISTFSQGYRVGAPHPGIYLSNVELQIVVGLLRNKSRERISHEVNISERSFDYYCCRLMRLMGYKEMDELIDALRQSELYRYIDVD